MSFFWCGNGGSMMVCLWTSFRGRVVASAVSSIALVMPYLAIRAAATFVALSASAGGQPRPSARARILRIVASSAASSACLSVNLSSCGVVKTS
jgi:hypothetical protein